MRQTCQFLPPYLVQRLANEPDDHLGSSGAHTMRVDASLRDQRATRPAAPSAAGDVDGTKVVYSAENTETLPGTRVRDDDQPPTGDVAVDEAYDATGQVHTVFVEIFGRNSIDDTGSAVAATVHYGQNYDNAFWNGEQLVFGDGDGTVFERFTKPPDVLFHEFVHGVTQYTAALSYEGQSGALNESISDCFAAICKQQLLGQSAERADWLIGEGLFAPGIQATALRSMKEPGTAYDDPRLGADPQVGSMADYVDTTDDNGGVHINSGIPNRAFYLAATGIGGNSWDAPGRIWYATLTGGRVTANTDFAGFARATIDTASELYGADSVEAAGVADAWATVSVTLAPAGDPAPAETIAVRRTGGFAGIVAEGELDLAASPHADEVADLLGRTDLDSLGSSPPQPDRFVYHVRIGRREVTVAEQDLTPELSRLIDRVLGR